MVMLSRGSVSGHVIDLPINQITCLEKKVVNIPFDGTAIRWQNFQAGTIWAGPGQQLFGGRMF
jgi:hypothetical protein